MNRKQKTIDRVQITVPCNDWIDFPFWHVLYPMNIKLKMSFNSVFLLDWPFEEWNLYWSDVRAHCAKKSFHLMIPTPFSKKSELLVSLFYLISFTFVRMQIISNKQWKLLFKFTLFIYFFPHKRQNIFQMFWYHL